MGFWLAWLCAGPSILFGVGAAIMVAVNDLGMNKMGLIYIVFFLAIPAGSFLIFWGGANAMALTAERWINPDDMRGIGKPRAFDIYNHPTHGYKAVKVGFCWPACIFGPLWMLSCRLWEQGGIFFGVLFFFNIANVVFPPSLFVTSPVSIFLAVAIFGLRGNRWRGTNLQSRDYRLVATVPAGSKDEAIVKAKESQSD